MDQKGSLTIIKISLLIIFLSGIIVSNSIINLYNEWSNYHKAKELRLVKDASVYFTEALKNFMFERGRTNVVLSNDQPISNENILFINQRRTASDEAFERGFTTIEKKYPEEAELLRIEYEKINDLRIIVSDEVTKPLQNRDNGIQEQWFDSCTEYINLVIARLEVISRQSHEDFFISNYFEGIVDSLLYRSVVGKESSIFTSAISQENTFDEKQYQELLILRGVSNQIWYDLEKDFAIIKSDSIISTLDNVREKYYIQFRPQQDRLLELALKNELYEGAGQEIAALSVPALDSISTISEVAVREISVEIDNRINRAFNRLLITLLLLILSVLVMVVAPIIINRNFVLPFKNIIQTIGCLSNGKTGVSIPYTKRKDEIGILANGVNMLQNTMNKELALRDKLEKTVNYLEEVSITDFLTGLYNRRYAENRMSELEKLYKRNGLIFSLIMCDIDLFKEVNDQYGHECGDKILLEISSVLSSFSRESDILARWGGEEFLFILQDTNKNGAKVLAERVRIDLENKTYEYENFEIKITMTFGIAAYDEKIGIDETLRKADRALFQGKNNGRNQVVVF